MSKNEEGEPLDRFTTLSPMLASYDADHLADPPTFNGMVPPDPLGFIPKQEKPGKRGAK